ncbi:putative glutamate synthase [NADPH], partial [Stegodyphus mimosarum]
MDYLEESQLHQEEYGCAAGKACNKNIVVIGGGDTGVDCIATALRENAKNITTLELLSKPPDSRPPVNVWPQLSRAFKVEYGHNDVKAKFGKDPRCYNVMPKEFLDDGKGNVCGIRVSKIHWRKNAAGRWEAQELTTCDKIIKADLILLALGFLGPEQDLVNKINVKLNLRSNIETPKGQYCTSIPRVYAAGDCHMGQSLVVNAIAEGRQAAREIDEDLMSASFLAGPGGVVSHLLTSE